MIALIDSIFNPILSWIDTANSYLQYLSVPASRPIEISDYLGYLVLLGPNWIMFISQSLALAFIYVVLYVIVTYKEMIISFKNLVKWW